jgi:hypothetical protein
MKEELQNLYKEYKEALTQKQMLNYHSDSREDTLDHFMWWVLTGILK